MTENPMLNLGVDQIAEEGGVKMATTVLALDEQKKAMEAMMVECDKKKEVTEDVLKKILVVQGLSLCLQKELESKKPLESKVLVEFSRLLQIENKRINRFVEKIFDSITGLFMEGEKEEKK